MVAISPIISMAAPSSSRVELKASSSSLGRAQIGRPPPTRVTEHSLAAGGSAETTPKPFNPLANQIVGPRRQRSSVPPPISVKASPAVEPIMPLQRPPPFLLSNFFAPLFPQNYGNMKNNLSFTVAQGKRPMITSEPNDFPPLTTKNPKPMAAQRNAQPRGPPPVKEPKKPSFKKSFREAVSSSWASTVDVSFPSTPVKASSTFEGEPAFVISEDEESKLAQKFRFALIAKFNRGRPSMAIIRQDVHKAGFTGEIYIGLIDQKHIILQFQLESDSHRLWMKKTWSFRGFQANIFRWSKDFCPEKESSIVPVWTRFPLLPVHLCDKETLFGIGSTVGDPLKLDLATAAMEKVLRPSEARICIAVDVLKPLPQRLRIGSQDKGRWQQIVYEDLPEFCTYCSKLGHSQLNCKGKGPVKVWIPKKKLAEKDKAPPASVNEAKEEGLLDQDKGAHDSNSELDSGTPSKKEELREIQTVNLTELDVPKPSSLPLITLPRSPLCCVQDKLNQFISNLGQFLELINKQEAGDQLLGQPPFDSTDHQLDSVNDQGKIKPGEPPNEACNTPVLEVVLKIAKEPRHWEEGECSGWHKDNYNSDLAVLQGMETLVWDEGKFLRTQDVSSPSDLALLKDLNCDTEVEDGQEECWSEGDGDRWTETSFDEDQRDELEDFIDKMERKHKPAKQTRTMEAIVSPKMSGRRLRDRNPFFSYSETRKWNRR